MEPNKDTTPPAEGEKPAEEQPKDEQDSPADALSRTPEDLEKEETETAAAAGEDPKATSAVDATEKKVSGFKKFWRKVNVYFLFFVLLVVVAGATTIVNYLNSQKAPVAPTIATQGLTQDTLKQLANTDATVGNAAQTLTIQGNAIIAGQTLARGNLNVAGNLQTGGSIQGPNLTISGTSNLGTAQINNLQVAQNVAIQGTTTMRDLNVSGASTFSGAITASQITVTRLIVSGNGSLQVPGHMSFAGPSPARTSVNATALGVGGSASISGSDTSGTINVNTGNNPAPGCYAQFTFNDKFPSTPRVIVGPVDVGAGQTQFYVVRGVTGFSICSANAAPANAVFAYDYFITF